MHKSSANPSNHADTNPVWHHRNSAPNYVCSNPLRHCQGIRLSIPPTSSIWPQKSNLLFITCLYLQDTHPHVLKSQTSFAKQVSDIRFCPLPMSSLSSFTTMAQRMSQFPAVFLQFQQGAGVIKSFTTFWVSQWGGEDTGRCPLHAAFSPPFLINDF